MENELFFKPTNSSTVVASKMLRNQNKIISNQSKMLAKQDEIIEELKNSQTEKIKEEIADALSFLIDKKFKELSNKIDKNSIAKLLEEMKHQNFVVESEVISKEDNALVVIDDKEKTPVLSLKKGLFGKDKWVEEK